MRTLLLVLDSVGCGNAPDAAEYGDEGANTLGHILERLPGLSLPTLGSLGLHEILSLANGESPLHVPGPAAIGVMQSSTAGKDTTSGHWEIAGVSLAEPFPVYEKFPADFVAELEAETGVQFLGNFAASGTVVIEQLGTKHLATGKPILYTSADSVLQIAAHAGILAEPALHALCAKARTVADKLRIGRVIARPFTGQPGSFQRTSGRHDYSFLPPPTVLDLLHSAGIPVTGIGKISDIFAAKGISVSFPTGSNREGMATIERLWQENKNDPSPGLLFANLVDFDMVFGHRRDVGGYAGALQEFDAWLGGWLPEISPQDLVLITADHGNDPTWPGSDHTREMVPLWVLGGVTPSVLGLRRTFADVAASLATRFGLSWTGAGTSFLTQS